MNTKSPKISLGKEKLKDRPVQRNQPSKTVLPITVVRMSARHYLSCLVADTKTCIEGSGGIHGDNEVSASAAF